MKTKKDSEIKLRERCEILAKTITSIKNVWRRATRNQKQFIETIIGAAIWYLPKNSKEFWTGYISINALKNHLSKKEAKPKLTEDHIIPRKVAAERLLKLKIINTEIIIKRYKEEYGKFNLITPEENRKLMPFQQRGKYKGWKNAYQKAHIQLIKNVSIGDLNKIKNRDHETIKKLLNSR